jgi:phage gpG-like protein
MGIKFKRVTKGAGLPGAQMRLDRMKDIKVGVLSGTGEHSKSDNGQTLAEIAFWNEFGTKEIPARPFLRVTIRENRHLLKRLIARLYDLIIQNKITTDAAQKVLGAKVAALVQKKITQLRDPPNTPHTIDRKGSSNPLVDTGELKNSISWDVLK